MRALVLILLFATCPASVLTWAGTPGVFQGRVVAPLEHAAEGWLYVQAPNGSVRRVQVSDAKFSYGDEIPARERHPVVPRRLATGTWVRVTAEQNATGEWHASLVEIVQLAAATTAR